LPKTRNGKIKRRIFTHSNKLIISVPGESLAILSRVANPTQGALCFLGIFSLSPFKVIN
jgi:hypothetical protein